MKVLAVLSALAACLGLPAGAAAAGPQPPKPIVLGSGWEVTDTPTDPRQVGAPSAWRPTAMPAVFDPDAAPALSPGTVKQYRLRFVAPPGRAFSWAFRFEQVRRTAAVYLNGTYVGGSLDPYAPFEIPAKGLRPGQPNELVVTVDNRKDNRLAEGWWNWGGIVRPVTLQPRGKATLGGLGLMSDVKCKGPATSCTAAVLVDGILAKLPQERGGRGRRQPQPVLNLTLRAPGGRVTRGRFPLTGSRARRKRIRLEVAVPRPRLWSPERPALYSAKVGLSYRGRTQQVERRKIGLRSVKVKRGLLYLNNRRIQMRGASIHEDEPGRGAAISEAHMDTTVRELKEVGANLTRAHYLLSEAQLNRFDRAGIMVWSQAPTWQRDAAPNLLKDPKDRAYAVGQVARTVKSARNHPSVITHSVGNELAFEPDRLFPTRAFLKNAADAAEDLDPTLPLSVDIKTRIRFGEQFTFKRFDMIGINQYFGWYEHNRDFNLLEPHLRELRDHYPDHALVMTEFGAEGRPDMANAPPGDKGGYRFQTNHVDRTMDVVERLPFMSGAIHWTLREFEIFPGWRGGALPGPGRNTRHHKGVLTYSGERKPAWFELQKHYRSTPLYP